MCPWNRTWCKNLTCLGSFDLLDLLTAVLFASKAHYVSMSWGATEFNGQIASDVFFGR